MRPILLILVLALALNAAAVPPESKVYTVATSHLDTQWRWDIRTTIDEYILNTLDDNFALLEKYPNYVFNFEGAFRYQLMQEYYPQRFERVKEYVRQGRWRVCGSWVDAVDVNMPSPESLFRHALYGNGWFRRELGVSSVDVFLPDCFGFGYALPSVMAHSGLKGFSTQKLTWGSAYGMPFDIGRWRGVDGSEVLATVNPGSYSADLEVDVSRDSTVIAAIERTVAAGGPAVAYKYYGTGDVGGSPSEGSVQLLEQSLKSDGPVKVISAGADQIFRELTEDQIARLPVYDGELVMTRHGTGCYTSEAVMKRWYRKCEVLADAAERAASLAWYLGGREYPHDELERAWTRFLWHGFHDDLTGTSIPSAYAYSWNDLLLSQQEFVQVLESSLSAVVGGMDTATEGIPVVLFNPLGYERTETVTVSLPGPIRDKAIRILSPSGVEVPVQYDTANLSRISFTATVPADGVVIYSAHHTRDLDRPTETPSWDAATNTLDTPRYRLRFGEEGLLSLFDKKIDRELLAAPPKLQLLHDDPERWSAWEIDYDDIMAAPYAEVPLGGIPESVVTGPQYSRLTFTHQAAGSVFRETLTVTGDRVDWDLDIDWATKATLLKAAFFTTARDTAVTYDLGLGAITRGLNRPKLYEVPAQRWADLTDSSGDFGLTVMNDSRYGWDHPDEGTLRLSLIHTPGISQNWTWLDDQKSQDLGRHQVKIGLMGHSTEWNEAAVREADCLNQPLLVFPAFGKHSGPLGRSLSLLQVDGAATHAVKKGEDGDWLVVRLQETSGTAASRVTVTAIAPITAVRELRADEVEIAAGTDLSIKDGVLTCNLKPYQPRTLALKLQAPEDDRHLEPRRSEPIILPWNIDGISTCADPTDGDWDGTGRSLPSELIPAEFTRDGVRFVTGPRGPGQANLIRCEGQVIELPASDLDRVQLLVCGTSTPRHLTQRKDLVPAGRQWFGQWDSRLAGEDAVHEADQVTPAFLADQDLGWIVTHSHEADGSTLSYDFTNFYRVEFRRESTLTLPNDPGIVILAASLVDSVNRLSNNDLIDKPNRPSVTIVPAGGTFVDEMTVNIASPNPEIDITVTLGAGQTEKWNGQPLLITGTTEVTVTASGPFPEKTVRRAVFTKVDPWPAVEASGTLPGLATRTYLGVWIVLPDWSTLTPGETVNPTVAIPAGLPAEDIGAVLTGVIDIPARGAYRFWLSSDDGSRLWIDGHLAADHDGLHGSSPLRCDVPLAAGPHTIKVEFFQHLGGADLKLEWSGPGIPRQEVPAAAFSH